jgi:hypothetical protein
VIADIAVIGKARISPRRSGDTEKDNLMLFNPL